MTANPTRRNGALLVILLFAQLLLMAGSVRGASGSTRLESWAMRVSSPVIGLTRWTDVARLSGRGMAAINYGPGDPSLAHQAAESVALSSVDRAFEVLREFLIDGQEDSSDELAQLLADEEG